MVVPTEPVFASLDKHGRLRLPADVAGNLPWLTSALQIGAWLYVVEPGRYRLLSEADAERSSTIKQVIEKIADAARPTPGDDPSEAESSPSAAVNALLVHASLSFTKGPGWRLHIRSHSYPIANLPEERGFFLLFSQGYLELWTAENLNRALHLAPDEAKG